MNEIQLFNQLRAAAMTGMKYHSALGLEYHNAEHVNHALLAHDQLFGTVAFSGSAGLAQKLAILYHDIVYIPGRLGNENEEASSRFFHWQVRQAVGELQFKKIEDEWLDNISRPTEPHGKEDLLYCCMYAASWIRCTTVTHHLGPGPYPRSVDVILDCDMAGMAKPYHAFKRQQLAICNENTPGLTGDKLQVALCQQAKFLQIFLKKKRIFRTAEALDAFESQARSNITQYADEFKE